MKNSIFSTVQGRSDNHRIRGVAKVIGKLLSSAEAEHFSVKNLDALRKRFPNWKQVHVGKCGTIREGKSICLWFIEFERIECLLIFRTPIELTLKEINVLTSFEKALEGLFSDSGRKLAQNVNRTATKYSLGNILVAHHLRGKASTHFRSIAVVLEELQELALESYEGRNTNSGFILISQPKEQLKDIQDAGFEIEHFKNNVEVHEGFFNGTISHRYVDGRNSFYIIDNLSNVYGIARLINPGKYSIYDRSAMGHLDDLMNGDNGRLYVAYVGRNRDVVVKSKGKATFRWSQLFWTAIDLEVLNEQIKLNSTMPEEMQKAVASIVMTCSDLRFGTLILIPEEDEVLPPEIGKIDDSPLSTEVVKLNTGKAISELVQSGSALGIFTSDGLTTISRSGHLLGSGSIVDLAGIDSAPIPGGGRTQAAVAASQFGLVIKVSEDGPISIFKKNEKLIEINF